MVCRRLIVFVFMLAVAVAVVLGRPALAASGDPLRSSVNQGTVTIVSGGVNGTYIRIASDLAAVLDNGDELRILPLVGKGSVQNITDLLYLRGVDVAIVQSDVLGFIRKEKMFPGIEERLRYVTKLYNEEVHVLAGRDVTQLGDLAGKKVNVDVAGSGTAMTAATLFDALHVSVEPTNYDQALALEKLKNGEIAAMVYVAGKPTDLFARIGEGSGLHFVPVPYTADLLQIYLPSSLTHADYPALVEEGRPVDTAAVGAVMAVYNWDARSERYKRVAGFVDTFFGNFGKFLAPPRHPKWREVNLAAELPGWTRFAPAQEWLDRRPAAGAASGPVPSGAGPSGPALSLRTSFDEFVEFLDTTDPRTGRTLEGRDRDALFKRFLEWRSRNAAEADQPASSASRPTSASPAPAASAPR